MQVLELVGKETMDLLITETGTNVENKEGQPQDNDDQFEEVTFDRCFYIYGGPEQLEVTFFIFLLNVIECNAGWNIVLVLSFGIAVIFRNWKHYPTTMLCYLTEEQQSYHLNRSLFMMES